MLFRYLIVTSVTIRCIVHTSEMNSWNPPFVGRMHQWKFKKVKRKQQFISSKIHAYHEEVWKHSIFDSKELKFRMNFYLFIRVWLHQNWQIVLLVGRYHMNSSTVQCYCVFFWTDGTCNCPVEINFKRAQLTLRNLKSSISDWRMRH